jgi:flagellar basal-body rod protein FlgC
MNLFDSLQISASGLQSQRTVITVISENMANAQTTRTEEGGPYLRKRAMLTPARVPSDPPFFELLNRRMEPEALGVKVQDVVQDTEGLKTIFDPSHPDADENGLVFLPNVNLMEEMVGLLAASRVFEANVAAFNAAKTMSLKSLEIGNR